MKARFVQLLGMLMHSISATFFAQARYVHVLECMCLCLFLFLKSLPSLAQSLVHIAPSFAIFYLYAVIAFYYIYFLNNQVHDIEFTRVKPSRMTAGSYVGNEIHLTKGLNVSGPLANQPGLPDIPVNNNDFY